MPSADPSEGAAGTISWFGLTFDGVPIASFSELGSVTSEAEPTDLGGRMLMKLPGKRKPPTVVLSRGLTSDLGLAAWHQSVREGEAPARKKAELTMYDVEGRPVARYHLENAWPSVLTVAPSGAGSHDVIMETVTLVCDRLERVAV